MFLHHKGPELVFVLILVDLADDAVVSSWAVGLVKQHAIQNARFFVLALHEVYAELI